MLKMWFCETKRESVVAYVYQIWFVIKQFIIQLYIYCTWYLNRLNYKEKKKIVTKRKKNQVSHNTVINGICTSLLESSLCKSFSSLRSLPFLYLWISLLWCLQLCHLDSEPFSLVPEMYIKLHHFSEMYIKLHHFCLFIELLEIEYILILTLSRFNLEGCLAQ